MNLERLTGLLAAIVGAAGTAILFFNSWAIQPLEGGVLGSPGLTEYNNRIRAKNDRRLMWQKVGLGLLLLSFILQAISLF
jgi:hypothetical protein